MIVIRIIILGDPGHHAARPARLEQALVHLGVHVEVPNTRINTISSLISLEVH